MLICGITLVFGGVALSTWGWGKGKHSVDFFGRCAGFSGLALILVETWK